MKKLSTIDEERQVAFVEELKAKAAKAKAAVEAYNEAVDRAQGFVDDLYQSADAYFDQRSTAWQESERGEAYCEWRDMFGVTFDKIELSTDDASTQLDSIDPRPREV